MRNIKKILNEENSEDQWNQADQFLIDTLNLTEDFTKESLNESISPKFMVGDIIRHKDYPDSKGIEILRIDYDLERYYGLPPSFVNAEGYPRILNTRTIKFEDQDNFTIIGGTSYDEDYEDLVMNSVGESKLYNKIMRNISREIKKTLNEMDQSYFIGKITNNVCPQCVTVKFKIIENGKESEVFSSRPPLTDWSRKYGYPHEHEDIFIPYAKDWIKRDILSTARRRKTPEEYNELWNNVSVEIVGWDYDDI